MRQYKVTANVEDSRRLGLLIGEGVAKAGAFARADEVLQAIASFTMQQTRMGMTAANVGGYAGMLSGMIGSGIPGMNPASAATLLGRVNSTIAGGGAAGDAGHNFMFRALGSSLGLDPIQATILREQGRLRHRRGHFQ